MDMHYDIFNGIIGPDFKFKLVQKQEQKQILVIFLCYRPWNFCERIKKLFYYNFSWTSVTTKIMVSVGQEAKADVVLISNKPKKKKTQFYWFFCILFRGFFVIGFENFCLPKHFMDVHYYLINCVSWFRLENRHI